MGVAYNQHHFIMSTDSKIRKNSTTENIVISRVYKGEFDKEGMMTAELKQTVTNESFYPAKSTHNSLNSNIFTTQDFGFEEQKFTNTETRVAWIAVPEGSTEEFVKERLASYPKANIYKILSNYPILTEEDKFAIESGEIEISLDSIANKQAVRYPEGHEEAGELIPDVSGKIQYRRTAFAKDGEEDKDYRTVPINNCYLSPALKQEFYNEVPEIIAAQAI